MIRIPKISYNSSYILLLFTLQYVISVASMCGFPGAPAHSTVKFNTKAVRKGTVAKYTCDRGFELLGPTRRLCGENGTWIPQGIPFCVLNVAAGKAPMQSSVANGGVPQKAIDGSTSKFFDASTCTKTEVERSPWWYVNLLEPYMVQLVRVDFGESCCENDTPATIVIRVGNNRPDLGINPVCNRFIGKIEEGRPLFLPCNPPMPGAFVSLHFESPIGVSFSICETFVYTDQALPIERCPSFRDQPPGSTATYNGKCYIFYNQQPENFERALSFCESRGGSLVDESNPALQGFLSWELWRRHKGDANGQYWNGAVRDREDSNNWKWINGKQVSVSFWNLPGGVENCARFDGTKGWLWSDTNCALRLNYICQHSPTTCGKPEQPPDSSLSSSGYNIGDIINYSCDVGNLLVGPSSRKCLSTGFYSEFPPICRFIQCGAPAEIPNSLITLQNRSFVFDSKIKYECKRGYILAGRSILTCDVDGRWDGPPPHCEPVYCQEPPPTRQGGVTLSTNSTRFGTVATYYCVNPRLQLNGGKSLYCREDGSWEGTVPRCIMAPIVTRKEDNFLERLPMPSNDRPIPFMSKYPPIKKRMEPRPLESNTLSGPMSNEIPDSANVIASRNPNVNLLNPIKVNKESLNANINWGGIIALAVFGGFVFVAAIVTTIVILIRRKGSSSGSLETDSFRNHIMDSASPTISSSPTRSSSHREGDRDGSELVITQSKDEKNRSHHHHHHHRHKHRSRSSSNRRT
ncbi:CUB and sushi domain-containing protein 3 isoform X2 [Lepeophtheirus salmonis]|uniref:Uncharacterized protein n=1 Tax=Lepeophtheirus salmonis TaxID=72036 RepID=A0A0K2TB82_LEPSM|nr:CUB and sushi domain-containing protein 3-like isoform X2 [Lepeophtheirus salmonis]